MSVPNARAHASQAASLLQAPKSSCCSSPYPRFRCLEGCPSPSPSPLPNLQRTRAHTHSRTHTQLLHIQMRYTHMRHTRPDCCCTGDSPHHDAHSAQQLAGWRASRGAPRRAALALTGPWGRPPGAPPLAAPLQQAGRCCPASEPAHACALPKPLPSARALLLLRILLAITSAPPTQRPRHRPAGGSDRQTARQQVSQVPNVEHKHKHMTTP